MKLETIVRTNIKNLNPYVSARDESQEGIFLDANENSFGSVIQSEVKNLNRYPDPNQTDLRNSLSKYLKVDQSNLFFGVGSDEIIDLLIRIFCEPRQSNVIIPQPTYGMYEVACDINNVEVRKCNLDRNFDIELNSIRNTIDEYSRIIFLCSPNNPTGNLLSKDRIKLLADLFNGIIFIDEAYIEFSENNSFLTELEQHNNVIISRTFSKSWGLAAARCGYCICNEYIINLLLKIKAPYTINKFTEAVILKALKKVKKKNDFVNKILSEKKRLIEKLNPIDDVVKIFPSDANFLLVEFKEAQKVFTKLNEKGIRVRMKSDHPVLMKCLRITIGTREENDLLIKTIKEMK